LFSMKLESKNAGRMPALPRRSFLRRPV